MRITLVISSLKGVGGAERVLTSLASHWAQKKEYQVSLITLGKEAPAYPLDEKVKLIQSDLFHSTGNFLQAISANFKRIKYLRKTIKSQNPDMVISFMTGTNVKTALAMTFSSIPVILSDRLNPNLNNRLWKYLAQIFYRLANLLVVQTEGVQPLYKNYGIPTKVINNPFDALRPMPIANTISSKRIVMVGRLDRQKRQDIGIRAFHTISAQYPDWEFLIFGEGAEKNKLQKLVEALALTERVHFMSNQPNIFDYLKSAAIFLMTSEGEGYPNALIEAMATALPCVCTDCDFGPAEIIQNHQNGTLVPVNDILEISAALETYIKNPELRVIHGKAASKIQEKLPIALIAEQWESLCPKKD